MVGQVQRGRQFWLPIVLCCAVIAAVWGLASLGTSPVSESTAPSEENEPDRASEEEEFDRQSDEAATSSSRAEEKPAPTSTTVSPLSSSSGRRDRSNPAAPVLGQVVGYDLLVSTRGRPAILDLDQAEVTALEGGRVYPVAISDPWLILEGRSSSGPEKLRLDDLGGDPTPVFDEQDLMFSNAMPTLGETESGMMWFSVYRESANGLSFIPSLELVELSSGRTVFHPLAAEGVQTIDLFGGRFANGAEGLLTGPSGGVYEARQDRYSLVVAGGRLIAADQRRALIETCDAVMRCDREWLSTDSWEPLDLRLPDRQAFLTVVMPSTDWVLTIRLSDTTLGTLLNIVTGRTLDLKLPESESSMHFPAVSPDGRWLAKIDADGQSVFFRDMLSGDTTSYAFDEPIEPPLFFIAD